jgi:excinuclease ABC subunit B
MSLLERIEIMQTFEKVFLILIGVNLLREGLIYLRSLRYSDADKEGFLRSHRSLTQTTGLKILMEKRSCIC